MTDRMMFRLQSRRARRMVLPLVLLFVALVGSSTRHTSRLAQAASIAVDSDATSSAAAAATVAGAVAATISVDATRATATNNSDVLTVATCTSTMETIHALPVMPTKIRAILHNDWAALDDDGPAMMERLQQYAEVMEFAHARDSFFMHLQGTFAVLSAWHQPRVIRRTGLLHTGYSGDLFHFYLFDAATERHRVLDIVGGDTESEQLIYYFGTVRRGQLCDLRHLVDGHRTMAATPLHHSSMQTVPHRIQGNVTLTASQIAGILIVTVADYLEQMVDTNGWRDHHQVEGTDKLYPGDGRPAIALYWMSAICHAVKDALEQVPPIFDQCQTILSVHDETRARDLYWHVVTQEEHLSWDEKVNRLHKATQYNPFIGEPHNMLAQLYFARHEYDQTVHHAQQALTCFYTLATAWDKRRSFAHWVGTSRVLALRATRRRKGETNSWPRDDDDGRGLISLHRVMIDLDAMERQQQHQQHNKTTDESHDGITSNVGASS